MSEENISIRLKLLLQKLGISSSVFADTCGISRATFSQLLTGRNKKISDVLVGQIHRAYPALSILWLLFNEGTMWIDQPNILTDNSANTYIKGNNKDQQPLTQRPLTSSDNQHERITDQVNLNSDNFDSATYAGINANNTYENTISSNNQSNFQTEAKENALNYSPASINTPDNKHFKCISQPYNNNDEIEKFNVKMRKVVQVTIYYDDSTFETLFPR